MRLEHNSPGSIVIVLSKRNVLALLHKVDWEESAATIDKLERVTIDGMDTFIQIVVRAESDDEHYAHESRVIPGLAGAMADETEVFIAVSQCGASDPGGTCHLPFGHTGNCMIRPDRA